jgi:hypothetical protein
MKTWRWRSDESVTEGRRMEYRRATTGAQKSTSLNLGTEFVRSNTLETLLRSGREVNTELTGITTTAGD